jgi:hypothetical protein
VTPVIVALSLAYAGIAALLLNLNLSSQYNTVLKTLAIVVVTGFYIVAWQGHQRLLGWATSSDFPAEFRVHWITIDEPDKATGEAGTIYFWLRELDEAGIAVGEPRAHRVSWDEKTAEEVQQAMAALEEGELLNGRMNRQVMAPETEIPEQTEVYDDAPTVSGSSGERPLFEFARVPPPALPAKPTP